ARPGRRTAQTRRSRADGRAVLRRAVGRPPGTPAAARGRRAERRGGRESRQDRGGGPAGAVRDGAEAPLPLIPPARGGRTRYFGSTFGSPPGVPGGGITGIGATFSAGGRFTAASSPVDGGCTTPSCGLLAGGVTRGSPVPFSSGSAAASSSS